MRVAVKEIFKVEQSKGKHLLQVKSELFSAKKEGTLFFINDVSTLTEKEDINIYFSKCSGPDSDRDAFPIPKENFILPKGEEARYSLFKKHYETYYPNSEMDYNLFLSFNTKPFQAKQCLWFFRQ